jgi:hypothetical protein
MDSGGGTGDRLVRVQKAALELAEVVEDLVRDMEMIAQNMPERTKRTHELTLAKRARELARAVRAAVADTHLHGHLGPSARTEPAAERRQRDRRQKDQVPGSAPERRSVETERRQRVRRQP